MPLGDKAKAALPLRAATLKQQAMITRQSGKAASDKLVWNQHYRPGLRGHHLSTWSNNVDQICSSTGYEIQPIIRSHSTRCILLSYIPIEV